MNKKEYLGLFIVFNIQAQSLDQVRDDNRGRTNNKVTRLSLTLSFRGKYWRKLGKTLGKFGRTLGIRFG